VLKVRFSRSVEKTARQSFLVDAFDDVGIDGLRIGFVLHEFGIESAQPLSERAAILVLELNQARAPETSQGARQAGSRARK
jgi:hypothetical protein